MIGVKNRYGFATPSTGFDPKGEYPNNTAALEAGLQVGDVYWLPNENDVFVLDIVKREQDYLLQENGSYLLQENLFKIII